MKVNQATIRGFTLVEILVTMTILAFVGTIIAQIVQRSTRSFNAKLWRQTTVKSIDRAFFKMQKYLKLASYPSLNTFKGVIRDRDDKFSMKIFPGNLEIEEAYSKNTKSLVRDSDGAGKVSFDEGAASYQYFGSGIKNDLSADNFENRVESNSPQTNILSWVSCQSGYESIPTFTDAKPRCGKHRLYLKNRSKVQRVVDDSYHFYQDLFMESSFCFSQGLEPTGGDQGYLRGLGTYECQDSDFVEDSRTPGLLDDEKNLVGTKLLVHNVATVTIFHYDKPNERSTTVGIDIVAVAPYYGTEVVKKSTQSNVSLRVVQQ